MTRDNDYLANLAGLERELSRADPELVNAFQRWHVSGLARHATQAAAHGTSHGSNDDRNPVTPLRWRSKLTIAIGGMFAVSLVLLVGPELGILALIAATSLWYLLVIGIDEQM